MERQRTIAQQVSCTGVGLHSGEPVRLTLLPASADTGITIVRSEGARGVEIPARASAVVSTRLATSLARDGASVATVEHLLAALYGLGVDNLRAVVEGPEIPVMDGSSASFVYLLHAAGLRVQPQRRSVLRIRRPVEVRDGERWIRVEPSRQLRISYAIDFDHPAVGRQELELEGVGPDRFEREIAPARTFGFLREVRALWEAGFARGGSLDNTIVLDDERVINPEGLRTRDELVRHKVLDLYGDLALLGLPLEGHVRVERGGHSVHLALVAAILAQPDAWEILGGEGAEQAPAGRLRVAAVGSS